MSITKINLIERFATIHSDGSIGVMPESYTLEKARKECFDGNQPDPNLQAKVGKIQFHITQILHDPVAAMEPENTHESVVSSLYDLKIDHYVCEDDPHFSCHATESSINYYDDPQITQRPQSVCDCGADAHNKRVDDLIAKVMS